MRITGCGYNFCHDSNFRADRPQGAGGYIFLIIRSPARITIDGKDHFVKGNTVIVYRRESPHLFGAHQAPFVNDWVRFNPSEADLTYISSIGVAFDTIYAYPDIYDLSYLVKLLSVESHSANQNTDKTTTLLLQLLFLKLSDSIAMKPAARSGLTERLTDLRNSIYSDPQNNWSIGSICKSMSISPSYLQHKYKDLFGNTIKSDITTSRLEYSKYLLSTTNHTIRDIAQMTGYENDVHFMYIFKKKLGVTPTEYRAAST